MATFQDVYDKTVEFTKRPELVALTKSCVRSATLRAHQVDFFPRDTALVPLTYVIDNSLSFVDIPNLTTQLPQLRAIDFLQSVDLSSLKPVENLEYREYKDFWDNEGELRSSVFTQIGDTLRLRPAVQTGRFDVLYYKLPVVTDAGYSSWIANAHIEDVAMWAAASLWARTGFLEQAKVAMEQHIAPFKADLVAAYLTGEVN